jgi:decaprenylphospho-beta-D-ribofuranose 2-oxidase
MSAAATNHVSRIPPPNRPSADPKARRDVLAGWGRYPSAECELYRPEKFSELQAVVARNSTSLIPRGAGRAYGDAALNDHNRIVNLERMNRMLAFDADTAVLRAEAGVTIADIIDVFMPRGFFPPVTPGTRFVTLGGSVAADVHGKNHHRASSLAAHVTSLDLMLASGEIRRCSREENGDLFRATVGGMGLTGVILELELKLKPIPSAWIDGELIRTANLDQAFDAFERADERYDYSVAWIDCAGGRSTLGRCALNAGNFAERAALWPRAAQEPYRIAPRLPLAVPFDLPAAALNSLTVNSFNTFYYAMNRPAVHRFFDWRWFFYPLDSIRNWNRIYGKRGFVQYQCVWPLAESRAGLIETLEAISRSRRGSPLTVLKKFGAQDGLLSFPMPGYTLAIDFPVADGLFEFLDQIDQMVLKRGGRVYLAKDARMRPEVFHAMYPNLAQWRSIKADADPENRFSSSLSRRLGIDPE